MEFRQQHQQQPCPSRHAEPSGLQQGESKRQPVAELQIVNIDYHMTSPTSVDCTPRPPYNVFEEPLKQVPVIRIFGTTRGQQRMCLHVHQVWPYLYVRYDGEASIEAVRGFGYQLGVGLNHALNVSLKSVGSLFVVAVVPVKGVPFYGFCAGYRPFLKIFLANPDMLLRASTLLAAGAVMSKKHEIFESHLSYVMQFMVDYNLYGVEWIRLDRLLFRSPLPMPVPFAGQHPLRIADDTVHAEHRWIPQGMPSYLVNPAPPDRVCHCELEADATAADIANRQQVRERAIHHVLSEGQLDVQFGRLVHSLDRIWIDENRRRAQHGLDLLQLKHSQLPTDATQLTDHEPSTQIRGRGFQWSSHWRMHSLLQSALADDRRKYRQQVGFKLGNPARDMLDADCSMSSNADVDEAIDLESFNSDSAWISAWPTCRQVDVGDMPLISCSDDPGHGRFYLHSAGRSSFALRQSGKAVPSLHGTTPESIHEVMPTVAPLPGALSDGTCTSDAGNESTDSSEPLHAGYQVLSSVSIHDTEDIDTLDASWVENELLKAEMRHKSSSDAPEPRILCSSRPPRRPSAIPQVDGADDKTKFIAPCDHRRLRSDTRREQSSHCGIGKKTGRGRMAPLFLSSLASSAATAPTTSVGLQTVAAASIAVMKSSKVDEAGKHSSQKKHYKRRCALPLHLASTDGLLVRRTSDSKLSTTIQAKPHRGAVASSRSYSATRRNIGRGQAVSLFPATRVTTSRPAATSSHKRRDVYVDIPHKEGEVIASYARRCHQDELLLVDSSYQCFSSNLESGDALASPSPNPIDSVSQYQFMRRPNDTDLTYSYALAPPRVSQLMESLVTYGLAESVVPVPRFSNDQDMPRRAKMYSGARIQPSSCSVHNLPLFNPMYLHTGSSGGQGDSCLRHKSSGRRREMWRKDAVARLNCLAVAAKHPHKQWHKGWWQFSAPPPRVLHRHLRTDGTHVVGASSTPVKSRRRDQSDLKWSSMLGTLSIHPDSACQDIAAVANTAELSHLAPTEPLTCTKKSLDSQGGQVPLSQMSLEILTCCSDSAKADPSLDAILCISACFVESASLESGRHEVRKDIVWTCEPLAPSVRMGLPSHAEQQHLTDELGMIMALVGWTRDADPDILCGYEVQQSSWGYVAKRAELAYNLQLQSELSRIDDGQEQRHSFLRSSRDQTSWGGRKGSTLKIVGRHMLNIWRLARSELSLTSYSLEKVAKEVLGEQSPYYQPHQLASWYVKGPTIARIRALHYVFSRARTAMRILDKLGIVSRAAEFASVIGIDFNSVLTRGSQLRVESMMARIVHPELYVLASPTRAQVAQQRAAECLPLVLEPQSRYYTDPVVVLDFQSLYPSIIIAYNYCYSTCLGSLEHSAAADSHAGAERRLGFTSVHEPAGMLSALKDNVVVSPNGVLFVKPTVRKGLLGRMLVELLESRAMLKEAMKLWGGSDQSLYKRLDAWQIGLKLIANVTYGYTGASFSGRMPCVEIADAIVQSGRETLESAIRLIHSRHATWGARVVYGDTDSVFVHLPGKSRQSAFRIGQEIAEAVTKMNPAPVKLKLEKVYQPCVLLTKKRYAGWMYTSAEQDEPLLDVKGMELVRRDGCVAMQRILKGTLDSLFKTNDLSLVRAYVTSEITKLLRGELPLHDYIIAKEARMGTYSGRVLPAHAKVAADAMQRDPRAEPQYGERVPYVVVSSGPNARLTDQVVRPQLLLTRPELRIDSRYYIDKQIVPALDRVLSLVGVDVRVWVNEMPRRLRSSICDAVLDVPSDSDGEVGDSRDHLLASGPPSMSGYHGWQNAKRTEATAGRSRAAPRTLKHFYSRRDCFLCGKAIAHAPSSPGPAKPAESGSARACDACAADRPAMLASVGSIQKQTSQALKNVLDQCAACVGGPRADALLAAQACECLDCPTMFQRSALSRRYAAWTRAAQALE